MSTTTTALKAAFPSGPLTNDDGTVTPAWRGYFQALYVRTGNAPGASTSGLDASIAAEANARASADAVLSNAIAAERTARETADAAEAAARTGSDASKLPLIGGTLTGPLTGPLASFTTFQSASTAGPTWTSGNGVPTSAQPLGSLYSRTDGAVGATLYLSRGGGPGCRSLVSEMPPPFVVFAMPRSRTAWLAQFLSYGPWTAGHDELRHCRSLEDVTSWLAQPCTGAVETSAAPFWRLLPPGTRVVTLRRPVPDVVASLRRGELAFDEQGMVRALERMECKLDQIEARLPDVLAMTYDDLATEAGCARVFEHCLGLPHDPAWWAACDPVNIQASLPALVRYYTAHAAQMTKLVAVAKHRTRALMTRAAVEPPEGFTFQHENARDFYRDAQHLFAEHLFQTGQSPEACDDKNWPLVFKMDDMGLIQTMTARSNGRIFGYLQTVIGPTFDAPDVVQAWHTIFFASPVVGGLGMKLQRAALARLREMGVDEVIMRAGTRGSGPRLGTFYRRLGAEDLGQLYRVGITRWDGQLRR